MLKKRLRAGLAERLDPGDDEPEFGAPGSIEQQLDMCTEGELRGDQIEQAHGRKFVDPDEEGTPEGGEPLDCFIQVDERRGSFQLLPDVDREDAEMSGDEHSRGLQGEEQEVEHQEHIDSGVPGDEDEKDSYFARKKNIRPWD